MTEIVDGRAKIKLDDMDGLITDLLPILQDDTQDTKKFSAPSVGAQVAIMLDSRGE